MKSTGVVRRIDDLGRVVIPKEIRRTLRFSEGDPLEIFIDNDKVCFKKYSAVSTILDIAEKYACAMSELVPHVVLVSDKDAIICAKGPNSKAYINKPILEFMSNSMRHRRSELRDTDKYMAFSVYTVAPIVVEGEPIGTISMLSTPQKSIGHAEYVQVQTAALFISKTLTI